ncbi:hypothetical protein TNCV_3332841 [Trichonephila clavipes]|nr:hypothetical protein TNCV_3332841 [Trichonephila clavipes]
MFRVAEKEDLLVVWVEMGETLDPGMNVEVLKQKLIQSKAYLEDEEFVRFFGHYDRGKKGRRTPFGKRTRIGISEKGNRRVQKEREQKKGENSETLKKIL